METSNPMGTPTPEKSPVSPPRAEVGEGDEKKIKYAVLDVDEDCPNVVSVNFFDNEDDVNKFLEGELYQEGYGIDIVELACLIASARRVWIEKSGKINMFVIEFDDDKYYDVMENYWREKRKTEVR
jgi:hypothetical protein